MSLIRYYKEPTLREPVIIAAFGGWNDAADAATTAIKFLIDHWSPLKIAEIDPEDFYVFTETRPTVKLVDGIQRTLVWPSNQFLAYSAPELTRDVILCLGVEPQLKWKTFSQAFLEICTHFNVSEAVCLGALLAEIPHSAAVPITGTSSDSEVMERLREMEVMSTRYEGPTGMIGVINDTCKNAGIPSATLWAAAPHYLAATPNVKVTSALLTHLNQFLSFGLDLSEIQSDAVSFEEQVSALVARDPDASAYVRKLEEQIESGVEEDDEDDDDIIVKNNPDRIISTGPLPSADSLIRGVEALLREQRQNGQATHIDDDDEEIE